VGGAVKQIWQESTVLGECDLIFVTVGGMRPFERLVKQMDLIAGKVDEEVVMQVGSTGYEPSNCHYLRFMPGNEIEKLYARARVVVCHAGIGSILTALKYSKPLILVPRMKKHGEHIDDHQLEIAREMERRGTTVVYDISKLQSALENVKASPVQLTSETSLVPRLKDYLNQLEKQTGRGRRKVQGTGVT
jgi:beta-1,4-N-acetylglucosaminyltransferase